MYHRDPFVVSIYRILMKVFNCKVLTISMIWLVTCAVVFSIPVANNTSSILSNQQSSPSKPIVLVVAANNNK